MALGTTLQVPEEMWPADRAAFDEYWQQSLDEGPHRRRRAGVPVPDRRGPRARGQLPGPLQRRLEGFTC